jgi:hypothetical protein
MKLADNSFRILLRIAVAQSNVFRVDILEVCLGSQLLLTHIPIHGPDFVIITGTNILILSLTFQSLLLSSHHAFDAVHHNEIMVILRHPLKLAYLALGLENQGNFMVRFNIKPCNHLEPLCD